MKHLILLLFLISCAHQQISNKSKKANKYDYLQEFYKLRDKLKLETKSCKNYMQTQIKPLLKKQVDGKVLKTVLKNPKVASDSYSPEIFDWDTKTKMSELYLSYPYKYEIVKEHFDIYNNIKDCMNDFSNMSFIRSAINSYNSSPQASDKIISKYLTYSKESELSVLNVLITANLILEMDKHSILRIVNKNELIQKKEQLEKFLSNSGKESLEHFRNENFEKVYTLAKELKSKKDSFKDYIFKNIQK